MTATSHNGNPMAVDDRPRPTATEICRRYGIDPARGDIPPGAAAKAAAAWREASGDGERQPQSGWSRLLRAVFGVHPDDRADRQFVEIKK